MLSGRTNVIVSTKILPFFKSIRNSAAFTMFIGVIFSQGISFLVTPVITRLYPANYIGFYGVVFSYSSVLAVIGCLSFDIAIVNAKNKSERNSLITLSIFIALLVFFICIFISIIYLFCTKNLGFNSFFNLASIFLLSLLTTLISIYKYYCISDNKLSLIALNNSIYSSSRAVLQILFSFFSLQFGLVLGDLMARGITNVNFPLKLIDKFNIRNLRTVFADYKAFAITGAPSILIDQINLAALLPCLNLVFGASIVGQFSVAQRMSLVPLALVSGTLSDFLHGSFSSKYKNDVKNLKKYFMKVTIGLSSASLLLCGFIAFFAYFFMDNFLGKSWELAVDTTLLSLPWMFFQIIVNPLSRIVFVLNLQKSKLIYDFANLTFTLASIFISYFLFKNYLYTIVALSITKAISYLLYYLFLLRSILLIK